MKIELIEILLVCIIVSVQVYVFSKTFIQIQDFKNIIPKTDSLFLFKIYVSDNDLKHLSPQEILLKIGDYRARNNGNEVEVNIIGVKNQVKPNAVFNKIVFSLNNYLIRNHSAASDFNLIKDIVERNTDTVEEDINSSIGIPLYLGLMGTMIGIVIGLFNMPELGTVIDSKEMDLKLNEGIGLLIGGVKIAMIASFVGLFFTIINSGWAFKGSRSFNEARKNEFYTFVQVELLPIINQGLASTFDSLQRNLLRFNHEFEINMRGLKEIFNANRSTIKEQKELLDSLNNADVAGIAKYNVTVLKQLNVSVEQFQKFNAYITNVNKFIENSQLIVNGTNELLTRTDNFKNIANNLDDKLTASQQLMTFLSSHFNNLQEHKEFTSNAVAEVGHSISETFKELKEHIQNSSEAVKQFTVDETEALKNALSESKTNLSNLEHLASLKADVSQFKNSSAIQGERLKQAIDDLNKNMSKSIVILEQIEKRDFSYRIKTITTSFKNLFKSKK